MKIEGRNAVTEALRAGTPMEKLLIEKGAEEKGSGGSIFRLARDKRIKYQFAPREMLDRESETKRHQGFIAYLAEHKYCEVSDILESAAAEGKPPFLVILDGVEDPHNLGSIIRVAECAGAHGIILPKYRSAAVNETVVRVSAGASEHVKIAQVTNINSEIESLKKQGIWVFGAENGGESAYLADLTGPLAVVIGSEGGGIKPLTKKLCDKIISIPMFGKLNSLNASVACGVVMFEAVRQREGNGK